MEFSSNGRIKLERAHCEAGGLEGVARAILFVLYTWNLDHPQVVHRAKLLDKWIAGGGLARVLSGAYPRRA